MIRALLTIDDITSRNTESIVGYLNEKGITAVMFAIGDKLESHPEAAVYALQHGMIVGNHSYSHPAFSGLSYDEAVEQISKCEEQIDKVYKAAGVERKYRFFRFPYGDKGGDKKEALQKYLRDSGFDKLRDTQLEYPWWKEHGHADDIDTFWTFDFAEYMIRPGSGFTKEDVFKRIDDPEPPWGAAMLKDGNNHLILLHAHDETEELVPEYYRQFIDYLLEHGVVFDVPEAK